MSSLMISDLAFLSDVNQELNLTGGTCKGNNYYPPKLPAYPAYPTYPQPYHYKCEVPGQCTGLVGTTAANLSRTEFAEEFGG